MKAERPFFASPFWFRRSRVRYYRVGPDFLDRETGELIELTTPAQVAAHQAKPGYEYLTYALYNLPPIP